MSKEEALEQMIDIASHNMDWFIAIISVLVGFFAFYQWFLNDRQINRLKESMRHEYEVKLKDSKKEILQNLQFKSGRDKFLLRAQELLIAILRKLKMKIYC